MSNPPIAVISDHGATPDTDETRKMASLIGKRLTMIEIRDEGEVYLEFNPYGAITVKHDVKIEIGCTVVSATSTERTQ